MSKSLGNFVGLRDEPNLMYGRVMSLSDQAMPDWLRLASGLDWSRMAETLDGLSTEELAPIEAKRLLARTVVARFHDDRAAQEAEDEFLRVHSRREMPSEIAEVPSPTTTSCTCRDCSSSTSASPRARGPPAHQRRRGALDGEPVAAFALPRAELAAARTRRQARRRGAPLRR